MVRRAKELADGGKKVEEKSDDSKCIEGIEHVKEEICETQKVTK